MQLAEALSRAAREAPESGIIALVNHARRREGVIALWVGEGDRPTPAFIRDAAVRSLRRGETFYTWQRGIPPLRQALADYHARHFGGAHDAETFFVTGSGMQAVRLCIEAVAAAGDEVVYLSPTWPNIFAALGICGVRAVPACLDFDETGWTFDADRLAAAAGPRTRALFVNTPSNPTGWMASEAELKMILAFARARGLWIVADEIYARFRYDGRRAPSFLDIVEDGDRVLFVNSFSKNWSMTGWRVGWIRAPAELGQIFENLIQYSTSGVAEFMQHAAIAALTEGEGYVEELKETARRNRDLLCEALLATNRVRLAKPAGAFYAFFAVEGLGDSAGAALRIVDETNVGLAPGSGFGPGGEAFLRACFLRRRDELEQAGERLTRFIRRL